MKIFFVLLTTITALSHTVGLCSFDCSCSKDSSCEYYCNGSRCQPEIPLWSTCSGHKIHPRECGLASYCELNTMTCEPQKNYNEWCIYDYSCLSGNCDSTTNTCRSKHPSSLWQFYILIPSLFIFLVLILLLLIDIRRQQRRFAYKSDQNCYVVLPASTPYSYQNSCFVEEIPSATYPDPIYPSTSKS